VVQTQIPNNRIKKKKKEKLSIISTPISPLPLFSKATSFLVVKEENDKKQWDLEAQNESLTPKFTIIKHRIFTSLEEALKQARPCDFIINCLQHVGFKTGLSLPIHFIGLKIKVQSISCKEAIPWVWSCDEREENQTMMLSINISSAITFKRGRFFVEGCCCFDNVTIGPGGHFKAKGCSFKMIFLDDDFGSLDLLDCRFDLSRQGLLPFCATC